MNTAGGNTQINPMFMGMEQIGDREVLPVYWFFSMGRMLEEFQGHCDYIILME